MKAILVIDMPDGYETDEVLFDYVLTTKGEYKVLRQGGNHEVRPMPESFDKPIEISTSREMNFGYMLGYNACLDDILGDD